MFLTEIQYREATARKLDGILGTEAREWATRHESDSLEVVIRGRLVNNLPNEILLTCRDHPASGRSVWYGHRNQSVFIIGGTEVELGESILSSRQEVTFEWIDRRSKEDWINIFNLHHRNLFNDPEFQIPRLTLLETIRAASRREPLDWARRSKVKRSGFQLVCEPRTTERVATVWKAEVKKVPVEVAGRDEHDRIVFGERKGTIQGPLDDSVVYYRATFDSTLALIDTPKRRVLAGRQL